MRITLAKLAAVVAIFCLPGVCGLPDCISINCLLKQPVHAADDYDDLLKDINKVQKEMAGPDVKKAMEECDALAGAVAESEKNEKETVKNISDMKMKYIKDVNFKDPWGNEYMLDADKCKIYSKGPDGKTGTADDVQSTYVSCGPKDSVEKSSRDKELDKRNCVANMKVLLGAAELYLMDYGKVKTLTVKELVEKKILKSEIFCRSVPGKPYSIYFMAPDGEIHVKCEVHGEPGD